MKTLKISHRVQGIFHSASLHPGWTVLLVQLSQLLHPGRLCGKQPLRFWTLAADEQEVISIYKKQEYTTHKKKESGRELPKILQGLEKLHYLGNDFKKYYSYNNQLNL